MSPDQPGQARARSAGILLHRRVAGELEVLLVHPGGPFWSQRDAGAWSIPKGEHQPGEEPLAAARREFEEELGSPPPDGDAVDLGEVRQKSGKLVGAWAIEGELDVERAQSNTFTMQWPPGSGERREFPEVDRAQWFGLQQARAKINSAQAVLLDRLEQSERGESP